jgi:hypothetical protein
MQFAIGFVYGLVVSAANLAVMYLGVRRIASGKGGAAGWLIPLLYVIRYAIFGALVALFFLLRLGSTWGLVAGVTVGIFGSMAWQVIRARTRRSDTL